MATDQLPHLFTFLEVAELECFTAAGRCLGISQAAVSQRIHALESSLGNQLFRRAAGRVTLTNAGRRLFEYARRIADLHNEVRAVLNTSQSEDDGDLTLVASSIPGNYVLPPSIKIFQRTFPRIRVHIRVSDSDSVKNSIENGKAELGFAGTLDSSTKLVAQPFANDELGLVVPAGHRLARRQRVGLRDIEHEPFIRREVGSGSRKCFERALERAGKNADALNIVLEVDGNEGVKEAVLQGRGVAVMSRCSVEKERLAGNVRVLPINGLNLKRSLLIIRDRRRVLTDAAAGFLACLQSRATF